MMKHLAYYARNDAEEAFDEEVKEAVRFAGDRALMGLYIQNQAVLSMLRRMEDKLDSIVSEN